MAEPNETVLKLHVDTSELDVFAERWHQATANGPAGPDNPDGVVNDVRRLAWFLFEHFRNEIIEDAPVDSAIALLQKLRLARQANEIDRKHWTSRIDALKAIIATHEEQAAQRWNIEKHMKELDDLDQRLRDIDGAVSDLIVDHKNLRDRVVKYASNRCPNAAAS